MRTDKASPGTFGQRLRELRAAAGLTQEELAERAGLTVYGVGALERGNRTRPYPHTVRALAGALGLDDDQRRLLLATLPAARAPRTEPAEAAVPTGPLAARQVMGQGTALHGREGDLAALAGLVRSRRLVTLTGPGGVGKTRLAAELAAALAPDHVDGARVVSLADVRRAEDLAVHVAVGLGLPAADQVVAVAGLAAEIAEWQVLLVLDNLEQVPDAGPLVSELVASTTGPRVLVTSRTPLRVRGETVMEVAPLSLPGSGCRDLADVGSAPAGAMLLERLAASNPAFVPVDADAAALVEICRRLAGLPLAVELVATPLGTLGPAELLARFDSVLDREGLADLPQRQRSLRATLDWSRELLPPREARLLSRLAVFRGGFTLGAAAAMGETGSDPGESVELLVHHSLLRTTRQPDGRVRYWMLPPVAEHALAVAASGEEREARERHARWAVGLAEAAAPEYAGGDQIAWLSRLDLEDANLSGALEWLLGPGDDAESAARLGWALWLFWWLRGRLRTGRDAMAQALSQALPPDVEGRALLTYAAMTLALGDLGSSAPAWERAVALGRTGDDWPLLVSAVAGSGLVHLQEGDLDAAERAMTEALGLSVRDDGWVGAWIAGLTEIWLGTIARARGDAETARAHLDRGLAAAVDRGDRLTAYIALFNLAQVALGHGQPDETRGHLERAVGLTVETRDAANLAAVAEATALLVSSEGADERVPLLLGAAEAMRQAAGGRVYGYYLPDEEAQRQAADRARTRLGAEEFGDLLDQGRGLSFDEAAQAILTA